MIRQIKYLLEKIRQFSCKWNILLILGVFVFLFSLFNLSSYDIYLHLFIGKYICHNLAVPFNGIGAAFFSNKAWIAHEWGYELLLYLVYFLAGFKGVIIFRALLIGALFLISTRWAISRGVGQVDVICLGLLTYALLRHHLFLSTRPFLMSYLFIVLLFILILDVHGKKRFFPYLYIMALLFIFWINLHPGFIFGFFILVIALIEDTLKNRKNLKRNIIFVAGTIVGLFINPYGWRLVFEPIIFMLNKGITAGNMDWQPLLPADFVYYLIFVLLSIIIYFFTFPKERIWQGIGIMSIFLLSVLHARHAAIAVVFIMMVDFVSLRLLFERRIIKQVWKNLISFLIMTFAIIVIVTSRIPDSPIFQFKKAWHLYVPDQAVAVMKRLSLKGEVFNFYDWGGYVLWRMFPDISVAIDGRNELYPSRYTKLYSDLLKGRIDADRWLSKKRVKICLLRNDYQIVQSLLKNSYWHVLWHDNVSVLMFRSFDLKH